MNEPRQAEAWMSALAEHGLGDVDTSLAASLRAFANLADQAVVLMAGPGVVGYVPWVRDGLPMTGKLIVQLHPCHRGLDTLVQSQLDLDIRVASHYQDLDGFLEDVFQHRFDLVIADEEDVGAFTRSLAMVKDRGAAILVGGEPSRRTLMESSSAEYFAAEHGPGASILTRKNVQHRRARRRQR